MNELNPYLVIAIGVCISALSYSFKVLHSLVTRVAVLEHQAIHQLRAVERLEDTIDRLQETNENTNWHHRNS